MHARSISLHSLGENRIQRLIVPFFQRKYIWERENWEELFDGFADGEETPFLGSMPRMMFSATVREDTSMKCWCTIPIPIFIAICGDDICTCFPFT